MLRLLLGSASGAVTCAEPQVPGNRLGGDRMHGKDMDGTGLRVLGTFDLWQSGRHSPVTPSGQRLLAFVAVEGRPVSRGQLAGSLWPDVRESEALARLRTALWRLNRSAPGLVHGDMHRLELSGALVVDLHRARQAAAELLSEGRGRETADVELFGTDLLPDWDDEWLSHHRFSFQLLRLRALEAIARDCLDKGDPHGAERAALAVIRSEPLRETAHMLLADVYVAEGNRGQAVRQLADYQRLLETELGAFPSERVRDFVAAIRAG